MGTCWAAECRCAGDPVVGWGPTPDETRQDVARLVAHVPVSDDGPWMVGIEVPETPDEALERCAAWIESLASATLSNDPHIRAADWAAQLVRQFAAERPEMVEE